jgi:glycosyltransferase involved in cell wall biosynthesis
MAQSLNVSLYVKFQGLVNNTQTYYLSAGIFVLPSIYEGTPNALLEAMSVGLSCIVSDSLPGALELIEDEKNGLVFSSEDVNDLARKLATLMKNPRLRVQLGKQARQDAKKFSPENIFPIWENVIQGL